MAFARSVCGWILIRLTVSFAHSFFCFDSLQNPNNGVIKMDDIEKIPLTHAKERSDDWKAAYMSVGIALIFFGSCSLIHSHVGSNTTQNFVVPIYRFHFHSPC